MATKTAPMIGLVWGGIMAALILLVCGPVVADDLDDRLGECLQGQLQRIRQGFEIAPVPLNLQGRRLGLVGLGSYIVNAQGGATIATQTHLTPRGVTPLPESPSRSTRRDT